MKPDAVDFVKCARCTVLRKLAHVELRPLDGTTTKAHQCRSVLECDRHRAELGLLDAGVAVRFRNVVPIASARRRKAKR